MDPKILLVANIVIGVLLTGTVGFAVAFARTRGRALRAEMAQRTVPAALEGQLAQLQQSIDAMALELERIAEAQRFTARLMSERTPGGAALPGASLQREPGTITPH